MRIPAINFKNCSHCLFDYCYNIVTFLSVLTYLNLSSILLSSPLCILYFSFNFASHNFYMIFFF